MRAPNTATPIQMSTVAVQGHATRVSCAHSTKGKQHADAAFGNSGHRQGSSAESDGPSAILFVRLVDSQHNSPVPRPCDRFLCSTAEGFVVHRFTCFVLMFCAVLCCLVCCAVPTAPCRQCKVEKNELVSRFPTTSISVLYVAPQTPNIVTAMMVVMFAARRPHIAKLPSRERGKMRRTRVVKHRVAV